MVSEREKYCPINIKPDQWAMLCDYWSKPKTKEKAQKMANARKQVKMQSNVGRACKAGKEAQLAWFSVFYYFHHVDSWLCCLHYVPYST